MMGEWSRYNFFLPRIIMLSDLYILLINKQNEEMKANKKKYDDLEKLLNDTKRQLAESEKNENPCPGTWSSIEDNVRERTVGTFSSIKYIYDYFLISRFFN